MAFKHFGLKKQTATMSFQSRIEKNGDENAPAATIHLRQVLSNEVLDLLGSHLRESFYRKELPADEPTDLAEQGLAPKDGLTRLLHPKIISAIKLGEALEGYIFEAFYGIGDDPVVKMGSVKVDGFEFTPMEGGSIELKHKISCHPDEEAAGHLHMMNGGEITYNLVKGKSSKSAQRELEEAVE